MIIMIMMMMILIIIIVYTNTYIEIYSYCSSDSSNPNVHLNVNESIRESIAAELHGAKPIPLRTILARAEHRMRQSPRPPSPYAPLQSQRVERPGRAPPCRLAPRAPPPAAAAAASLAHLSRFAAARSSSRHGPPSRHASPCLDRLQRSHESPLRYSLLRYSLLHYSLLHSSLLHYSLHWYCLPHHSLPHDSPLLLEAPPPSSSPSPSWPLPWALRSPASRIDSSRLEEVSTLGGWEKKHLISDM